MDGFSLLAIGLLGQGVPPVEPAPQPPSLDDQHSESTTSAPDPNVVKIAQLPSLDTSYPEFSQIKRIRTQRLANQLGKAVGESVEPSVSITTPAAAPAATPSADIFTQTLPQPTAAAPDTSIRPETLPDFTVPPAPRVSARPASGGQLYYQRLAALQAGRLYTRLPADSFRRYWQSVTARPTYQQWLRLLAQEAGAAGRGQGNNHLSVLLGDSLSLWVPQEGLSNDRLWLNQGISGDTTAGVLKRLSVLNQTQPDTIYVMVGINDLRRGYSDRTILTNLYQIAAQLRRQHPRSRIVMQSILPTRYDAIPTHRIDRLNQQLAAIAQHTGTEYLDLTRFFRDEAGVLRLDLTTDGLHLNPSGYRVWQLALNQNSTGYRQSSL